MLLSGSPAARLFSSSLHSFSSARSRFAAQASGFGAMRAAGGTDAKKRAIGQLLSLRGVNESTVKSIFALLGETPTTRRGVHAVVSSKADAVRSCIELPLLSGGTFSWPTALPQRLLPQLFRERPAFRAAMQRSLAARPASINQPWRLVLYLDEITPGNPLRPDNKRKITAFYVSWLELGDFLRLEEAWLTVGVLRTSVTKDIRGGMSAVVRSLLRALFAGADSLSDSGVMLDDRIFFSRYHRLLRDEAAGKSVWTVKGAAGLKPCQDCKNVVALGAEEDDATHEASLARFDADGYLVDIACPDASRFDPMKDEDLWHAHDVLAEMKRTHGVTKNAFEHMEKALGVSYCPDSLIADVGLRQFVRPSSYVRDPMRIMLAGGVMNTEIYAVLRALFQGWPGFKYAVLREWCEADWAWPKSRSKANLGEVFSDVRESASHAARQFKSGASETLAVYPLVRYFIEAVVPADRIVSERSSFFAACDVIDLMQSAKRKSDRLVLRDLLRKVGSFFEAHIRAYGQQYIRPKHHYMFHMTKQAEEDGFWLDCFVHERKHQLAKSCAHHIENTSSFELTLLRSVTHCAFEQWQDVEATCLLPPTAESSDLSIAFDRPCVIANHMRWHLLHISVGDVLFIAHVACLVDGCLLLGEEYGLLVQRMGLVDKVSPTASLWQRTSREAVILTPGTVRHAACWHRTPGGDLVIIGA